MTKNKTPLPPADSQVLLRILDANFNRAREALRILEDLARFFLQDKQATTRLKNLRHKFVKTLKLLPAEPAKLLASRQVGKDYGARLYTPSEGRRRSLAQILLTNFKRVEESLRSLEEFSKILNAKLGYQFKRLRFEAYWLEKKIILPLLNKIK